MELECFEVALLYQRDQKEMCSSNRKVAIVRRLISTNSRCLTVIYQERPWKSNRFDCRKGNGRHPDFRKDNEAKDFSALINKRFKINKAVIDSEIRFNGYYIF